MSKRNIPTPVGINQDIQRFLIGNMAPPKLVKVLKADVAYQLDRPSVKKQRLKLI